MQTIVIDYLGIFRFLVVCPQYMNLTDADRKHGPGTTGSPKCDEHALWLASFPWRCREKNDDHMSID